MAQPLPFIGLLIVSTAPVFAAEYSARIRRTAYGIPHITASSFASIGFAEGYAQAEDHVCTIADRVIKARGERARYFGPGRNQEHVLSDITSKALRFSERAAERLPRESSQVRELFEGFAAGYNQYLRETSADRLPAWCRGAAWVTPVTAAELAGAAEATFLPPIPWASPPGAGARPSASAVFPAGHTGARVLSQPIFDNEPSSMAGLRAPRRLGACPTRALVEFYTGQGASNGWALGKELSASGRGMLAANPHYPWVGALRFWEKHLVIPGKLDVYGVNLIGMPGVIIGFNDSVAWTHTISAAKTQTFYRLKLAPGTPTSYLYDGAARAMTRQEISVDVRQADGSLRKLQTVVWFSHHGPVIDLPGLGWTETSAIALRDVTIERGARLAHWVRMAQARSLKELQQAHVEEPGLGPVNTIATSKEGIAWYIDSAPVPQLSDQALAAWQQSLKDDKIARGMFDHGLVLLDGSISGNEWVANANQAAEGIVPYAAKPRLERRDYVFNANDSFWLANSKALLSGPYTPLHGAQRSPRSLRTRNNDLTISNRLFSRPAGQDGKFTLDELGDALLSNISLTAAILKPALVEECRRQPVARAGDREVDLTEACRVLAAWDGRYDLDSRGAVLFREFISRYPAGELLRRGSLFAVEFDPNDPVNTPREAALNQAALENLAEAVLLLRARNIALDVPLGELQYANKAGRRMPVHGGQGGYEGILNMQIGGRNTTTLEPGEQPAPVKGSRFLTETGYPVVHGSSFLMALEFSREGPRAKAFLTYGQSGDPASPHFTDQTELFARKQWRPILFREAEIRKNVVRAYAIGAVRGVPMERGRPKRPAGRRLQAGGLPHDLPHGSVPALLVESVPALLVGPVPALLMEPVPALLSAPR
jgi:acyl-homoserine-lactone acylase